MIRIVRYTKPLVDLHDYLVFDTETTGVNVYDDKVVQYAVAAVKQDIIVDSECSFVNPGCRIPAEASAINHIYDQDIQDAPSYRDIAPHLFSVMRGKVVVAHNARFDIWMLRDILSTYDASGVIYYVDTLSYARAVIKGVSNYKLQTLAQELNLDTPNAHRADSDAITCHQLFQCCKAHTIDPSYAQKPIQTADPEWLSAIDFTPSQPAPPDSKIRGHLVAFTGSYQHKKADLYQMAADAGAKIQDRVTQKTEYLVRGAPVDGTFNQDGKTQKVLYAEEINEKGVGHISIISESEFIALCGSVSIPTSPRHEATPESDDLHSPATKKTSKLRWIYVGVSVILALLFFPSISSALFLLAACIVIPLKIADDFASSKKISLPIRIVLSIVFVLAGICLT